jgi:hypothetical protein
MRIRLGRVIVVATHLASALPTAVPVRGVVEALRRVVILAGLLAIASPALAQTPAAPRFRAALEGAVFAASRNDVRIPPVGGTEFSIVDLIGAAPTPSLRAELTVGLTDRQDVRLTYAPLKITGRGTANGPIAFAGTLFQPAETGAEFKFSSYRATWRYRVHAGDTWTWRVGFTAFVRDARIALDQSDRKADDVDVGFVPLGHLDGEARLNERWHLSLDLDGTAAPQGRAFDFAAMINYRPTPRVTLSAGYRTIEGGADVDRVYTFAWLHAGIARISLGF